MDLSRPLLYKKLSWVDSNRGPPVSGATTVPFELQPSPRLMWILRNNRRWLCILRTLHLTLIPQLSKNTSSNPPQRFLLVARQYFIKAERMIGGYLNHNHHGIINRWVIFLILIGIVFFICNFFNNMRQVPKVFICTNLLSTYTNVSSSLFGTLTHSRQCDKMSVLFIIWPFTTLKLCPINTIKLLPNLDQNFAK